MFVRKAMTLFVVIGFVAEDSHGAVYLLHKEKAHHLMRKGHLAQGDFSVGACIDRLRETVRSTHYKHDIPPRRHLLLQILAELY